MPSSLNVAELTNVILQNLPPALDQAVSTINPLWSQTRDSGAGVVGEYARLPIIRRRPMTSALGPYRLVTVDANVSGAAYTPGGALPAASAEHTVPQQLAWGTYRASLDLTKFDVQRIESGNMQIQGYLESQRMGMADSYVRALAADVFAGAAAPNMIGLNVGGIYGAAYGGIVRALFPNHAPFTQNGGGGAVTMAALNLAWDTFRTTVEYNPGSWFGVTTPALMLTLRALAGADVATWNTDRRVKSLGQNAVEYEGIPIFVLPGAVAGCIDFYRGEGLAWEFLADTPFVMDGPQYVGDTYTWPAYCHTAICLDNPRKNSFGMFNYV